MINFISKCIWLRLRAAAASTRRPTDVAVAYFGTGASKLLPLPKGSRLVVDASESAVKSGQTCPAELKKLTQKNGVRVCSVENLHAKVFVLGATAFIGSTNVSRRSRDTLLEAVVATTDRAAVREARQFVRDLCLHELGPEELDRLQRMYRPPRMTGKRGGRRLPSGNDVRPALPMLRLAQLAAGDPPEGSESVQEAGEKIARKRMDSPRGHVLEEFWWRGQCPYRQGDLVMQVLEEGTGRRMASPPGAVVHTEVWKQGSKKCTFVYLELPKARRVALGRLAKRIGVGARKRLLRGGKVGRDFAERVLDAWRD